MTHPRPRLLSAVALASAAALALTGCGDAPAEKSGDTGAYAAGDVKLDAKPEKIVSLSATATEMLFAIDAGDQVEAVDVASTYPKKAPATELDAYKPNVESITAYEPDLVVVSHDQDDIRKKLDDVKVPTYYAPAATDLDDTYQQIEDLGDLTGHGDAARELTGQMADDIDAMVAELPKTKEKRTAYYELDDKYYSLTSKTFAGSLLAEAGLSNIADAADDAEETGGYPQLSGEYILDANPDFIFVTGDGAAADVADREGWNALSAVKQDQVVELDADVSSRWGPRVVDLMKDITDAVGKDK